MAETAKAASQRWLPIAAGGAILLLLCFSWRSPWADPPKASAAQGAPAMRVRPEEHVLGRLDGVVISNPDPQTGRRWLRAEGWAVSAVPGVAVESVTVLLDGKPVGYVEQLLPRADIAAAYGRAEFRYAGWRSSANLERLSSGEHEVNIRVRLAGDESVDLPGRKVWAP